MSEQPYSSGAQLRRARLRAGLSLREVAKRAGTSHATLSAYERGLKSPTLDTFIRIVIACDLALDFTFRKRVRSRRGLPRGEELEAVLRLAAEFPARPSRTLDGPVIARLGTASDA